MENPVYLAKRIIFNYLIVFNKEFPDYKTALAYKNWSGRKKLFGEFFIVCEDELKEEENIVFVPIRK